MFKAEEKPDTKDGEKTDVKTEAHDDGTGAWGLDSGDPDAKMIVDIFDPILVTVHHDAFVRFWDLEVSIKNLLIRNHAFGNLQGTLFSIQN